MGHFVIQPGGYFGMREEVVVYKPILFEALGRGDSEKGAREYTRLGLELKSYHGMVKVDLTELRTKLAVLAITPYQPPSLKILSSGGLSLY